MVLSGHNQRARKNAEEVYKNSSLNFNDDDHGMHARVLLYVAALALIQGRKHYYTDMKKEYMADTRNRIFWTLLAEFSSQMSQKSVDPAIELLFKAHLTTENFLTNKEWWPLHSAAACKHTNDSDLVTIGQAITNHHEKAIGEAKLLPYHLAAAVRDPNLDVIRRLRGFSLRSSRVKDGHGNVPLHYAAYASNSVGMMELLLQDYPAGVTDKNADGRSCAHILCYNTSLNASELLSVILAVNPAATNVRDRDGQSCAHMLCDSENSPPDAADMLRLVLAASPSVATIPGKNGQLPLHDIMFRKDRWSQDVSQQQDMALQLIVAYPEGPAILDSIGQSPLHLLCTLQYSGMNLVLQSILTACPVATRVLDASGQTCAHLLTSPYQRQIQALELLRIMMTADPAIAAIQDEDGQLPLHFIVEDREQDLHYDEEEGDEGFGKELEAAALQLIRAYPEGCAVLNGDGESPLYRLCWLHYSFTGLGRILEAMLVSCPSAINIRDNRGRGPLHIVAKRKDVDFFRSLYVARPQAIQECDSENLTVLHHCVTAFTPNMAMLQVVYDLDPSAIMVVTNNGNSVLNLFLQYHHKNAVSEVACFLIRKYPEAALIADDGGRTPCSRMRSGPTMFNRLLLRAAPTYRPEELRALNYSARRMALFLFYVGVQSSGELTLFSRLSHSPRGWGLVRTVVSFL